MAEELVLEMRGIRKEFPGIVANDDVDLDIRRGEVHALLGENGAGKSTLMNILYGLYRPDAGEILLNGKPVDVHLGARRDRRRDRDGAPALHADPGDDRRREHRARRRAAPRPAARRARRRAARARAVRALRRSPSIPAALVSDITVGQEQRVEILKALYRGADILILDEPTAVLTPQEAHELFEIIRSLQADGKSIIFISHKLNEVLEIADRITVLRRGKKIETVPREGATEESLARAMVGREVLLRVEKAAGAARRRRCSRSRISTSATTAASRRCAASRSTSGPARSSGIAGVDGNGQTELIDAITGPAKIRRAARSRSRGASCAHASAREMLDAGVGHIPEDRQRRGLVLEFSIAENIALHDYAKPPTAKWGWLFPNRLVERAPPPDQGVRRARRRAARRAPAGSRAAISRRSSPRARSRATRRC